MDVSEVELVQGCLAGDGVSQLRLVEQFQGMVFGLCLRMLGHRQDAEDITQEVFLRTFRHLRHWDQARPLRPWLLTIAANRCRTFLENRGRRPTSVDFSAEVPADRSPPARSDDAEEIQMALLRLRPEYRECFVLFYQNELSIEEVADVLGCPEGTVKTWLHRARKEIAEHLQRRGIDLD